MIQQQPYQNRIHIFHVTDGKIWTFKNEMEACKYTNSIQSLGTVGEHFKSFGHENWVTYPDDNALRNTPHYDYNDVIIRDDYGEIVTLHHLIYLWNKSHRKTRPRWYYNYNSWSKSGHYRWCRHPHTTNERRQAVENRDSYEDYGVVIKPRGSRNYHSLPNTYDDLVRTFKTGWKAQKRKHQWR